MVGQRPRDAKWPPHFWWRLAVPALLLPLLLVPLLLALAQAACGSCNCPLTNVNVFVFPAELDVQLAATGEACPYQPACLQRGDGGGCTQYNVEFRRTGACRVTATAADGRQVSVDLSVRVLWESDCCGTALGTDYTGPVTLSFDQDASR